MNKVLITIAIVVVVVVVGLGVMLSNSDIPSAPSAEEIPARNDQANPNVGDDALPGAPTP